MRRPGPTLPTLLVGLALSSCGDDSAALQPLGTPGGRPVVHLVDTPEAVEEYEGPLGDLWIPQPCTRSLEMVEMSAGVWMQGLLWPALAGSVQLLGADGKPAHSAEDFQTFLKSQDSYVVLPRRERAEAEDLDFPKGNRRERELTHGVPTHVLLKDKEVLRWTHDLLALRRGTTLRLRARNADDGKPSTLRVVMNGQVIGDLAIGGDAWSEYTIGLPTNTRSQEIRLLGLPPEGEESPERYVDRKRRVLVDWVELQSSEHDLLVLRRDTAPPDSWRIRFLPELPTRNQPLFLTNGPEAGTARGWLCSIGGPLTLHLPEGVTSCRVDGETRELVDGALTLSSLGHGLHDLQVAGCDGGPMVADQPWSDVAVLFLDPNLRHRDSGGALRDVELCDRLLTRASCSFDRRSAFWMPAPSRLEVSATLRVGDRLRYSTGVDTENELGDRRQPNATRFQVSWQRGSSNRVLGVHGSEPGELWQDHEVEIDAGLAGDGVLVFETSGEADPGVAAAFADPRIVPARDQRAAMPNVVVYLIDTLRADRMSCYGASRDTTANIDRFAQSGYLFEECVAASSWTRPSTASVLTGLQPVDHRCMFLSSTLTTDVTTMQETFRAAGYSTWGVVFNEQVGYRPLHFDQGFHRFVSGPGIWDLPLPGRFGAEKVNEFLRPWLEHNGDEPFLLYVHTLDMHSPYVAPEELVKAYVGERPECFKDLELTPKDTFKAAGLFHSLGDREIEYLKGVYDAQLKVHDIATGKFFTLLDDLHLDPVTLLTSDHGEEFYEHQGWEHTAKMWREVLHVPLILRVPEALRVRAHLGPVGVRIPGSVQHVDILPTLLELAGVPALRENQGTSLLDLLRRPDDATRPILVEESEDLGSLLDGRYKLVWNTQKLRPPPDPLALFDVRDDRAERNDLADQNPQEVERLMALREDFQKDFRDIASRLHVAGAEAELDLSMWRRLKELGYMDDESPPTKDDSEPD